MPGGANGALQGNHPPMFEGDREKTNDWLYAFMLWFWINRQKETMANPLSRVALALSYIGGSAKTWARSQIVAANDRIHQGVLPNDEQHWNAFYNDFLNTWKDDSLQENSLLKLSRLSMSRDVKVNDYIATFNALLAELGWQRNHPGTVKAFRAGLQSWIPQRIYDRDQYPREDDLDGWQEAARKEVSRSKLKKQEAGGAFGKGGLTVRENLLNNFLKAKKGRRIDDDAMDIDTTEIRRTEGPKTEGFKKLNPEERKKLQTEGRCFKCKRQGHLARNCPSGGQGSRTPQGREFQKRGFKKKAIG